MAYFTPNQSLSHGTMRNEDLLQTFARSLDGALEEEGAKQHWHNKIVQEAFALVQQYSDAPDSVDEETASDVVNSLFDALNCYAPENTYFGAHEGDGSDYGFWMREDDSDLDGVGC